MPLYTTPLHNFVNIHSPSFLSFPLFFRGSAFRIPSSLTLHTLYQPGKYIHPSNHTPPLPPTKTNNGLPHIPRIPKAPSPSPPRRQTPPPPTHGRPLRLDGARRRLHTLPLPIPAPPPLAPRRSSSVRATTPRRSGARAESEGAGGKL